MVVPPEVVLGIIGSLLCCIGISAFTTKGQSEESSCPCCNLCGNSGQGSQLQRDQMVRTYQMQNMAYQQADRAQRLGDHIIREARAAAEDALNPGANGAAPDIPSIASPSPAACMGHAHCCPHHCPPSAHQAFPIVAFLQMPDKVDPYAGAFIYR